MAKLAHDNRNVNPNTSRQNFSPILWAKLFFQLLGKYPYITIKLTLSQKDETIWSSIRMQTSTILRQICLNKWVLNNTKISPLEKCIGSKILENELIIFRTGKKNRRGGRD